MPKNTGRRTIEQVRPLMFGHRRRGDKKKAVSTQRAGMYNK